MTDSTSWVNFSIEFNYSSSRKLAVVALSCSSQSCKNFTKRCRPWTATPYADSKCNLLSNDARLLPEASLLVRRQALCQNIVRVIQVIGPNVTLPATEERAFSTRTSIIPLGALGEIERPFRLPPVLRDEPGLREAEHLLVYLRREVEPMLSVPPRPAPASASGFLGSRHPRELGETCA